ncbi:MAG: ATP-binding protein [Thalassotalea sp.]
MFLSISSTFIQLYAHFKDEVSALEQRFVSIESSYLEAISSSLWDFNESLVKQQIEGIVNLPDIEYVEIKTNFDNKYVAGNESVVVEKQEAYPIFYGENEIGELIVYASYQDIYAKIEQRASIILLGEFIKIFIVAFLIVWIVHLLITRHIYHITHYSQNLNSSNLDLALVLDSRPNSKDELDELADAINKMRVNLKDEITKLETAENELLQFSGELEVKVFERTEALQSSNAQLQQSLSDLTLAKDQLVQSEKMASLGQLVAGVAHEVNTPLGICVTSISALKEKVQELQIDVEAGKLTKTKLIANLALFTDYQNIIENSLMKSVELIRSFKSVAVEQHTDPEISINLAKHVVDVVNTVKTLFKRKNYELTIDVDSDLNIVTFPSAWNQILTNFLMNSHIHGFEDQMDGQIGISFKLKNNELELIYKDNGKGIDKSLRKLIFDPFVTTKRGQGGSGLGLNIVFNLVSSKLGGTIECLDNSPGIIFKVVVPIGEQEVNIP